MAGDLDYLTARLHGRRSRLAEGERLDAVCAVRDLDGLRQATRSAAADSATAFQRHLVQSLVQELSDFLRSLEGPQASLVAWMLTRFQIENIKVLMRGPFNQCPLADLEKHLLALPPDLALEAPVLAGAESLDQFLEHLPRSLPRKHLKAAIDVAQRSAGLFFLEAALDRGYFDELLVRTRQVSSQEQEVIQSLVDQEVDQFQLMLIVRGRFHYQLTPEELSPCHIAGSRLTNERFHAMLASPDLAGVAGLALGRVIDALPAERATGEGKVPRDAATIEALAWSRYLRLANGAFRQDPVGLGAVLGYVAIRRIEVMNLITVSEGIRTQRPAEAIRRRLAPRADLEPAHV